MTSRKAGPTDLKTDWQFLRNWLSGVVPQELPPRNQMELLFRHRVAALASSTQLQEPYWEPVRRQKQSQLLFAMKTQDLFTKVARRCQQQGFSVLPLKGTSLMSTIYASDMSRRQVSDIDLLVLPENLEALNQILVELGYTVKSRLMRLPEYQRYKRKVEYKHPQPGMHGFDVHCAFIVKKSICHHAGFDLHDIFARARTVTTQGGTLELLDPIDEWLFLAYHFGLHHRFSGLKWLVDIYEYTLNFSPEEWEQLLQRSASSGLDKIVLATLQLLEHVFPTPPPHCQRKPQCRLGIVTRTWLRDAINTRSLMYRDIDQGKQGLSKKIGEYFWEILFIDTTKHQAKALLHALLPKRGLITAITRKNSLLLHALLFPLTPVVALLAMLIFAVITLVKMTFRRKEE